MVDQVAIIIPSEYRIDFFFTSYEASSTDMREWVDELIEDCDPANLDGDSVRDLMRVCRAIVQRMENGKTQPPFTDDLLGKVMCAGLYLKDESLCRAALNVVMKRLPQPETVKVIEHFGFHKLKNQ
jgi:hypothetical protein